VKSSLNEKANRSGRRHVDDVFGSEAARET
jgi:hypothetical protein